ncbi:GDYXXLXY domain-containing protein [Diaphorobacter aerolatus]|uniref:GDYXXLXY domain-containing protein n=1 Tax=Diaphorobacter aerolatus TaxID=1288495 RepID=A0A7H0GH20_9BURK|nr:GDYXXLXY domain-containing protein [Diaphorobacter aerolatus]QNP47586.1 GDYXXLXY domain-containing protein [Diaphorobacter aerolatus]
MAAWSRVRLACLIVGALLVFGLVNWDVRGKEQVITAGQPVLVRLVPVDPRSLMQGDYMALNFSLPTEVRKALEGTFAPTARVRARLDARGEATVLGLLGEGASAGPGEIILPLKQLKGRWALVTDAYFFPKARARCSSGQSLATSACCPMAARCSWVWPMPRANRYRCHARSRKASGWSAN